MVSFRISSFFCLPWLNPIESVLFCYLALCKPIGCLKVRLPDAGVHGKAEPYLIEIPSNKTVPSNFLMHKGEEVGYLFSRKLQLKLGKAAYNSRTGDVIYLPTEMSTQWRSPGPGVARIL
jgi:hypothetical protein